MQNLAYVYVQNQQNCEINVAPYYVICYNKYKHYSLNGHYIKTY